MPSSASAFRVGRVKAYLRNKIWYLCYFENGVRRRPRVGPDRDSARKLAAQTNAQLETEVPTLLSFETLSIEELRTRWLANHENVLRSSVSTIQRYRTATDHLLRFVSHVEPVRSTAALRAVHVERFVQHLRSIKVAPNGHANAAKRPLLDKGILFILEACRAMYSYAIKRRHLPPYAPNPFAASDLGRLTVEIRKPVELFTLEQERKFFEACDDWQYGVFATLALTGMRPGELTHLLLPHDLDLERGLIRIRNRARLGWQVKTRNEREIPVPEILSQILARLTRDRRTGPVFLRRRFLRCEPPPMAQMDEQDLERELEQRTLTQNADGTAGNRQSYNVFARKLWREMGSIKGDKIRYEFMHLTKRIGLPMITCPKMLRHLFATTLQEANVDPLVRTEVMGHSVGQIRSILGCTSIYTHTKLETKRSQLTTALAVRTSIHNRVF